MQFFMGTDVNSCLGYFIILLFLLGFQKSKVEAQSLKLNGDWQGLVNDSIYVELYIDHDKILVISPNGGIEPFAYYEYKHDTVFIAEHIHGISSSVNFWRIQRHNKDSLIFYTKEGDHCRFRNEKLEHNMQISNYNYDSLTNHMWDRYILYMQMLNRKLK